MTNMTPKFIAARQKECADLLRDNIEGFLRWRFENNLAEEIERNLELEREQWEERRSKEIAVALREYFEDHIEENIDYEIQKRRERARDELAALGGTES